MKRWAAILLIALLTFSLLAGMILPYVTAVEAAAFL